MKQKTNTYQVGQRLYVYSTGFNEILEYIIIKKYSSNKYTIMLYDYYPHSVHDKLYKKVISREKLDMHYYSTSHECATALNNFIDAKLKDPDLMGCHKTFYKHSHVEIPDYYLPPIENVSTDTHEVQRKKDVRAYRKKVLQKNRYPQRDGELLISITVNDYDSTQ